MTVLRGALLQATYRIHTAPDGGRCPVVHLYGRLENGETFLVRDDGQRPHFYIRQADAERARLLGAPAPQESDERSFGSEPVATVTMEVPSDVPPLRDRLHRDGIDTFEADVRFATRYLIERGIKGGCEIEGDAEPGEGVSWVFDNPILRPAEVRITPRVLSFDIETDLGGEQLLAISLYGEGLDEVLIVDAGDRPMPPHAVRCADEVAALDAFCARVREGDPDVVTGWNTIDFDFTVLQRIAARHRHPFQLGRDAGNLRIRKAEGWFGSGQASIPGRLVLDGIDLLRGAFVRMEDYSLETVAREVLGEGKALEGDVHGRGAEIVHNYRHNLAAFALYSRTDARLAYAIIDKLSLVRLAFERSQLAGMMPDRVAASIASFDFVYLSELRKLKVVAPSVRSGDSRVHAAQQGGHVLEPVTGLHRNVWVFDFRSLYPSVIRTFNIDPVSYVPDASPGDDLIHTPGCAFRRQPAILPRLLDDLFPRRAAAIESGDKVASHAIKILMNSFYGVLGTPACRFYNPALANSITGTGKALLLWSKEWFEDAGFRVLYGDTDSLFVEAALDEGAAGARIARDATIAGSSSQAGEETVMVATVERGARLAEELNRELALYIRERWNVESRLELQLEKLYRRLFLPTARHSARGASKRYVGLRQDGELGFVGMEVVRSDWTALAKDVQRELYRRLFDDEPVEDYLAHVVAELRRGALDHALVYRKQLRKSAAAYTATTPPHVAAARKSVQPPGRTISYVMTTDGAEPVDNVQHPLDREHYVTKQVKPVAEPVLALLGLRFEQAIGDERQIEMSF